MLQEITLRVLARRRETDRACTLTLAPRKGRLTYRAGQFLTFLFDELGARPIRRSYSLSSAPGVDEHLAITVKKQTNGLVSRYLHDKVEVGQCLRALPPAGKFVLPEQDLPDQIVLFGGGSGVTPLFGLLKDLLHHHPRVRVLLMLANRDEREIIFRDALTRYAKAFPERLCLKHFLSVPKTPMPDLREALAPARVHWGRLSNARMEGELASFAVHAERSTLFYLCGPPALLLKTREVLGFLGFSDEQVRRELFTVRKPFRPDPGRYPPARVSLRVDGAEHQFEVSPGQTILEAAEAHQLRLPYSCRSGSCTTCSAQCTRGKVEMYTPDGRMDSEASGGEVLTCVGYPLTDDIVLRMP